MGIIKWEQFGSETTMLKRKGIGRIFKGENRNREKRIKQ